MKGAQVEELYSLDMDSLTELGDVLGLIFLFKYVREPPKPTVDASSLPGLFFAKQVVTNACATQALLSILLNRSEKVQLGSTLENFRDFTMTLPPDMKGLAIGSSDEIRTCHNSFSRPEPFFHDGKDDSKEEKDVYHFISYVPYQGRVYELDGLQPGPIELGQSENWLEVAAPAMQDRIARYSGSEIRFNLLALVGNRKDVALAKISQYEARLLELELLLASGPSNSGDLQAEKAQLEAEMAGCNATIAEEESKFRQWKQENIRRKHNYVPLALRLLQALAEKNKLVDLVKNAKERNDTKNAAASKRKAADTNL